MSEVKTHKIYRLLPRGPQFWGVPVPWLFCIMIGSAILFVTGKAVTGKFIGGMAGAALGIAFYGCASFYAQLDPATLPRMLLTLRGIVFPEETTSFCQCSQVVVWKEGNND